MSLFKGSQWIDGALQVQNTVFCHEIFSPDLQNMICPTKTLLLSDIFTYVSGCHLKKINTFFIYWHTHGTIIYALTGITFCKKIKIVCGSCISTSMCKIYEVPKIFLVNKSKNVEIKWKIPIKMKEQNINKKQVMQKEMSCIPSHFLSFEETDQFIESLSSLYFIISSDNDNLKSKTEIQMISRCKKLAINEEIFLMSVSNIQHFILRQVCLYKLDGVNIFEEIRGAIRINKNLTKHDFYLHKEMLITAYEIAVVFNSIYNNRNKLPDLENRSITRLSIVEKYFQPFINMTNTVIFYSNMTLDLLRKHKSISDVKTYLKTFIDIQSIATKDDVIRLLL